MTAYIHGTERSEQDRLAALNRLTNSAFIQFLDISAGSRVRFDPPCPVFEEVFDAFQRYQATLGGDSLVGRRLYRLFRAAGFSQIELSVQPEVHWHGSPGFLGWMQNAIAIVEGARSGL